MIALRKAQSASALLTALFVVAITAIIAISVIYKFRLMTHLATLNNATDQSYLYLKGIQKQILGNITRYSNSWNMPTPHGLLVMPHAIKPKTIHTIKLSARIIDAQSLFNINSLSINNNAPQFINMLLNIDPTLSKEQAITLVTHIKNWITAGNTDDSIYARMQPAYRPAHQPMLTIETLTKVAGMTPELFDKIAPFITALPNNQSSGMININTATPTVLLSLSGEMDRQTAAKLWECIHSHGVFLRISDYNTACSIPLGLKSTAAITTHSQFFIVDSMATKGQQQTQLRSLLSVVKNNKTKQFSSYIVWQMPG